MTETTRDPRMLALVDRFYDLCDADPVLGPLFRAALSDMPAHKEIVADFWSDHLLGTNLYKGGGMFGVHMNKGLEIDQFDRWLTCFDQATTETLPADLKPLAMNKANHMSHSLKVGLFPFHGMPGGPPKVRG